MQRATVSAKYIVLQSGENARPLEKLNAFVRHMHRTVQIDAKTESLAPQAIGVKV